MADELAFWAITPDDIAELAALVADAFTAYRAFAPPDWQAPSAGAQVEVLERWITDPDFWGELAAVDGRTPVGHTTFVPAERHSVRAARDPVVAHLGHLFVRPAHWGSGVAAQLLARAADAASGRGFEVMRLFVPVGQARARRFYAREGFALVGDPFDLGLGLPLLEYKRSLRS
jgi:GNAT superfamily N-acetyltransferase